MSPGEQFALAKIQVGLLELREGEVWYFHNKRWRWYKKVPDACPVSGRLRFRFGPSRSTVFRNRLVWMLIHKKEVPEGFVVDHKDGLRTNDHPDNLGLMTREDSHKQGYGIQEDVILGRLCRWFAFVGQHFREPQTPAEISLVEVGF